VSVAEPPPVPVVLVVNEELARLIDQQQRDDRSDRAVYHGSVPFSQLRTGDGTVGIAPDGLVDHRTPEPSQRLQDLESGNRYLKALAGKIVGSGLIWSSDVVAYDPAQPCPACEGLRLQGEQSCLICSRSGEAPKRHPMRGTPTRARPKKRRSKTTGKELAGGCGGKVKPKAHRRSNPWADYVAPGWV
jgi:hypothetical protein